MPASLLSHVLLDGPGTEAFLYAPLEARSDLFQVQESLMQTKRGAGAWPFIRLPAHLWAEEPTAGRTMISGPETDPKWRASLACVLWSGCMAQLGRMQSWGWGRLRIQSPRESPAPSRPHPAFDKGEFNAGGLITNVHCWLL